MKTKIFILIASIVCMFSCTDGLRNDIDDLKNKYDNLDSRVAKLEEHCKEMNTNISSLQTLVSVILNNDYIVSITPIMKENKEVGYTITFAIHAPITIYHGQNGADGKDGQNGKDGENGKDGKDGVTPIIGVAQDEEDHAYYWTLNGEWLLDVNGNRIPLTSRDGKDGKDGQDGKPGQNGQDGQDGITPQLKIENGYWYVSTDSGTTWTQLGKAVGENGQDGKDGEDGQDGKDGKDGQDGADGDSMFSSVTQDENYVYFTLANGTILTVPKYKDDSVKIIDGAIMAEFSVSDTKKVYFSMGNLRKQHNSQTGEDEYLIAESQDLPLDSSYWFSWSTYGSHPIVNGGNNTWRALNHSEWEYLINNYMYIFATVINANNSKVSGVIIFPNNYQPIPYSPEVSYTIYRNLWIEWQKHGTIFLNIRNHNYEYTSNYKYYYWAYDYANHSPYYLQADEKQLWVSNHYNYSQLENGMYRLVKDVE